MEKSVPKKQESRKYYQYAKTTELKKKLAADTIISAFTIRMNNGGSVICVAHGHARKTGVTNVVKMVIQTDELSEKIMGLDYLRMEPDWDDQLDKVNIADVEEMISTSCLLLPLMLEVGRTKQCMYAVVHDDWSVTNGRGQTAVPKLCAGLMNRNMD